MVPVQQGAAGRSNVKSFGTSDLANIGREYEICCMKPLHLLHIQLPTTMPENGSTAAHLRVQSTAGGKSRVLILSDDPWWTRALESIFAPSGHAVAKASPADSIPNFAAAVASDAIVIHAQGLNGAAAELCTQLRSLPEAGAITPLILVADTPLSREQRIQALRMGIWECFAPPLDAEAMVLKIGTYIAARRAALRARECSLMDQATGLYNAHGLIQWINELGQTAQRHHRPLGCAVFGLPRADASVAPEWSTNDGSIQLLVGLFESQARASDIVGRLSHSEFVVVAPETDSVGVRLMAGRYLRALEQQVRAGEHSPVPVSAGCYGVSDFSSLKIEPVELIVKATMALRRVQDHGRGGEVQLYLEAPAQN